MKPSLLLAFIALFGCVCVHAQTPVPNFFVTDGTVRAIARDTDRIYVGGDFKFIGPNAPYGNAISTTTGLVSQAYAKPNGIVYASLPDGSGGWYIAGAFTMVGTSNRAGLAHLNADGSVNAWDPGVTGGTIYALALDGTTLYLGGNFTQVGGQSRVALAAVDVNTATPTSWNPAVYSSYGRTVRALTISNGTLYAGGEFELINGSSRTNFAAFDLATGTLTSLSVNITGPHVFPSPVSVNAIVVSNGIVYLGGFFETISGQYRTSAAAIDAITGTVSAWHPDPMLGSFGTVYSMVLNNNIMYIAGRFSDIGGYSRGGIAAVNMTLGSALSTWNANPQPVPSTINNNGAFALATDGIYLYAGGLYSTFSGFTEIPNLAALNLTTGSLVQTIGGTNGQVYSLSYGGGKLYVGGDFISVGGRAKSYVAALNSNTYQIEGWTPDVNGPVRAIAIGNGGNVFGGRGSVYLAGDFTSPRHYVVREYAMFGGAVSTFNADAIIPAGSSSTNIQTLAFRNGKLYVGGNFSYQLNGQTRNNIAVLDSVTAATTGWDPGTVDGAVHAVSVSNGVVYAAGDFTTIGGQSRNRVAALTEGTPATVTSWNASLTGSTVNAITISNGTIYLGGIFTNAGGQSRTNIAALSLTTGQALPWTANTDAGVNALAISGTRLTAGGAFTTIGGQSRNYLATVDAGSGTVYSGNYGVNNTVLAVADDGTRIYTGGTFLQAGGQVRPRLAAFDAPSAAPLPVRLVSFTARPEAMGGSWQVQCNWVTASEQNSRSFIIERSIDGRSYTQVGTVAASGTSSDLRYYSFNDGAAVQGISYYRLRQVYADGRSVYSTIAIVNINSATGAVVIYPNPVRDEANIIVSVMQKQQARYTIVDAGGSTVREGSWQLNAGSNTLTLVTSGLPKGSYTLVIRAQAQFQRTGFIRY